MARPPNFGFEKRKKEQDRKANRDAKREQRRLRRAERREGGDDAAAPDPSAPASDVEPDRSPSNEP